MATVKLAIPLASTESLPLVHVTDVAAMIEHLVEAENHSFTCYNTPSETWKLGDLAAYAGTLNPNLQFEFGQSTVRGIPRRIDGRRFEREFKRTCTSIKERLQQAV